ncbi:hypothetical protein NDI44_27150 [Trichocoleus sp. DQ-A3]|uniref:hypothetical protein n=1 Tax=Cyanophyceae TaxID=3028117 RepID=UPI00168561F1|nr:hypothetical protein [Coleofasciculus sp. FACHB-125]MBD1903865.1 hypothetical protein [Coleofasciculus sp. FACHB-125]
MTLPDSALYHRKFDGTLHPLEAKDGELPILTRVKLGCWSCYIPQGLEPNNQNIYHSVSNILKLTQDKRTKESLLRWETNVGQAEAKRIRDGAIKAGNTIHAYLHSYLTEEKVTLVDKLYQPYLTALNQVLPFFESPLLSEQLIVNFKHKYLGKIDQFGLYRGRLTLSDFKTSLKPKNSLSWIQDKILQLAAYYLSIKTLYPVEQAALIYLISDGSYNEFLFTPEEIDFYNKLWLEKVSQANNVANFAA